jgi:glycine cleavage system aminomethyltransferase T
MVFFMKKSPFHIVHEKMDANFASFDGWSLPADFGDIEAECKAIKENCAVVDLCSYGRIQVDGQSAKETIDRVFNTEKSIIAQGSWVWARSNDTDSLCRIVRCNGSYTLLTQPDLVEQYFEKLDGGNDISVSNVTDKTAMLGLYGPKAFDSVCKILPFDIAHLDQGEAEKVPFMMMSFTVLRGSWLNSEGLELICPAAAGPLAAGAVAKYRHRHNITPAGMICLQATISEIKNPL